MTGASPPAAPTRAEIAQVQPAAPGMPGEEEIAEAILDTGINIGGSSWPDEHRRDAGEIARAILSLIRPAFEAKDQQVSELAQLLDKQMGTPCEQIRHQQEVDDLKAKLAQAVEALEKAKQERLKLDNRIHYQRAALRENWRIVEMRKKWLGSDTARIGYINARKMAMGWRERALDAEAKVALLDCAAASAIRGEK